LGGRKAFVSWLVWVSGQAACASPRNWAIPIGDGGRSGRVGGFSGTSSLLTGVVAADARCTVEAMSISTVARAAVLLTLVACSGCSDLSSDPSLPDGSIDGDASSGDGDGDGDGQGLDASVSGDASSAPGDGGDGEVDNPCAPSESPGPFVDERALVHETPDEAHAFFRIEVVDEANDEPLAGARLTTVNRIELEADVNGVVAFYEPGLMDQEIYFDVAYPGYARPADAFGYTGARLQVSEGGSATIELQAMGSATPPIVTSDLQTRLASGPVPSSSECFAVEVVDADTGRGVPLVRVTLDGQEYWTDSSGLVAFCDPDRVGSMRQAELWSHGYASRSLELMASAGGSATVELERLNIAERLYRITGQGIYRDSVLLGRNVPLESPVLNGEVVGQDTVQATPYRDGIFWVWGDTNRPSYPLGNFHTSSALSDPSDRGGLPQSAGIDLRYFVDGDGFSKQMAPPSTVPGEGVTWLGSLIAVPDGSGEERLFAHYAKVPAQLMAGEIGVVRYDDAQELFVEALQLPTVESRGPTGHPTRWLEPGGDYVYYQPPLRIPATAEAMVDPGLYETFTALAEGSASELEKNADGTLAYAWKRNTDYTTRELLESQAIASDQALDGFVTDIESGDDINVHGATSRTWNAYRQRFVEMVQEIGGSSSFMGEIWYAEADTPLGPWVYARKIVSHDRHTFYNPRQHPFFDQQAGRRIYFEGTYVTTFAGDGVVPTPRYDYNQVMYRLDLDDPRLALPVAVYDEGGASDGLARSLATKAQLSPDAPPLRALFFAHDKPGADRVAVSWSTASCAAPRLVATAAGSSPPTPPLFYALAASTEASARPEDAVPLFEHTNAAGERAYAAGEAEIAGFSRGGAPIAYVWRSPIAVPLPVADFLGELVADAGEDVCASGVGEQRIELDASGSRSLRGTIARARWSARVDDRCVSAEGIQAGLELPAGLHTITLETWDERGGRDTDTSLVLIEPD
jgi:hypothetical protein